MTVRTLCIYCGARVGRDPRFAEAAKEIGNGLAARGIELVFGGGRVGLMGVAADACLAAGGRVTGIIPRHLHDREVGHTGATELLVVPNMHERKRMMVERSDAIAVLPGGLGTLDEAFEVATWKQLGLHDLPILVLDLDGYWQPLLALIGHAIREDFAPPPVADLFSVVPTVPSLFAAIEQVAPPRFDFRERWA
ncbi:MAG: TIGR00730 family Rossman fold protein [Alphaproteobacteria bacterium]